MNNEIQTALRTAKEQKQLVALYRDELECTDFSGIPVLVSQTLALLAKETDFSLDGYAAVRLDDVTCLEQIDDLPFIRKLAQGEGIYQKAAVPKLCDCDSWNGLLGAVQAGYGGWMTAETKDDEGCCFFMGTISRLDENYLYLRQIDPDGNRRQEETTIPLQDLITVTFGGRYVELYRKYVR